ncbi:MAG: uroporphyrinogen-III synthase [Rickettsiaceae bacterium]
MKKTVLLTRSKQANAKLKKQLAGRNFKLLECNLIEYKAIPINKNLINNFSSLLITSYFAAGQLPPAPHNDILTFVVGHKSAEILAKKGYKIIMQERDAETLKAKIPLYLHSNMLYLSGNNITVDMPDAITRQVIYEVIYLKSLSSHQIKLYQQGIDYILLYSQNCAKILLQLMTENDLLKYMANSTIIAISEKVGMVFQKQRANIIVSYEPESILQSMETKNK